MLDPRFESTAIEEAGTVRCIHRVAGDLATDHDWHFHPQLELTWFIRSTGTRYVGDNAEAYAPGDLVLSGACLPHCWRNDTAEGAGMAEWISVQFDVAAWGADLLDLPEAAALRTLLEEAGAGLAFAPDVAESVAPALRDLCDISGLERILSLLEVLDRLSRSPRRRLASLEYEAVTGAQARSVDRLGQVVRYVSTRFRGRASQSELAASMGMTPAALSKLIRTMSGGTFTGMVKHMRINEACRQLVHSSARITDIALDCGYAQTSHFDLHFRELKGVTPSEYRRRMASMSEHSGEKSCNSARKRRIAG